MMEAMQTELFHLRVPLDFKFSLHSTVLDSIRHMMGGRSLLFAIPEHKALFSHSNSYQTFATFPVSSSTVRCKRTLDTYH